MGKPAARITDMHVCPMVTGIVPHVGGPIILGAPTVLTGMMPQARVGDQLVCVGPPDVIVMGSAGVFVTKKPAARIADQTAHGGLIVLGCFTVLIGEIGMGNASASGSFSPKAGVPRSGTEADWDGGTITDGEGGQSQAQTQAGQADLPVSLAYVSAQDQIETLVQAAVAGAPFCQACFQAAMADLQAAASEL